MTPVLGCAPPEDPEPPDTFVTVRARVDADYTTINGMGGTPALGGIVKFEGNNTTKEAALGTEVSLGQAVKGSRVPYNITITGSFVHPAYFNSTNITADGGITSLRTDVIDNRTVNIPKFIQSILINGNINWRYDHKGTLALSFNPDDQVPGALGPRLPDAYIIETENTVALIAQRSNGIITSVTSDRNGNYTLAPAPDGEGRTFYTSDAGTGVANIVYPVNGDRVKSWLFRINPAGAQPYEVPGDVVDAFFQGNQNLTPSNPETSLWIWQAIELSFKRPAGNDQNYKMFLDHEERTGWPVSLTSSLTSDVTITEYSDNTAPASADHSSLPVLSDSNMRNGDFPPGMPRVIYMNPAATKKQDQARVNKVR